MQLLDQFGRVIRKSKTLGEQINDNAFKQMFNPTTHETGETVNEFWKDLYKKMLDSVQKERRKGYKGTVYIQIREKKLPEALGVNGDEYKIFTRKTRPTPEQATSLYTHRLGDEAPNFEYILPELSWIEKIMREKNSGKFTEKYINDIQAFIEGRLR
jgi:hypothetical protein